MYIIEVYHVLNWIAHQTIIFTHDVKLVEFTEYPSNAQRKLVVVSGFHSIGNIVRSQ